MDRLERKLKTIISEKLGVHQDKVTPQAHLVDDLGGDSLDMIELVMCFEDEFDIGIPDHDVKDGNDKLKITNLMGWVEYIREKI